MILLMVNAGATICYQETANVSTGCGGLATGNYAAWGDWQDLSNVYDGNWDNWGLGASPSWIGELNVTYQKPNGATNNTLWMAKSVEELRNLTIDSDCWNYDANYLYFHIKSDSNNEFGDFDCFDGNGYVNLFTWGYQINEEGIYWEIQEAPTNNPPQVIYVAQVNPTGNVNPVESSTTPVTWEVHIQDLDGTNEIDTVSLHVFDTLGDNTRTVSCEKKNNITSTTICYQETANISTDCGGLAGGSYSTNGVYDFMKSIDGDWDTYSQPVIPYYANITYQKPLESKRTNTKWLIKDDVGIINLTINESCWNYSANYLYLGYEQENWRCFDGSAWINVLYRPTAIEESYEEAMFWSIEPSPSLNLTCQVDIPYYFIPDDPHYVNVTANDSSSASGFNDSITMQMNTLDAFTISDNAIPFGTVSYGQTELGALTNPSLLNNTGNYQLSTVEIKAYDLMSGSNIFSADSFKVGRFDYFTGQTMANNTYVEISNLNIYRHTDSDKDPTEIYFWIIEVLTAAKGNYAPINAWEIKGSE